MVFRFLLGLLLIVALNHFSVISQTISGPLLVDNEGRLSKVLIVDTGNGYCRRTGSFLSGHTEHFLAKHANGEITVCLVVNLMYKPNLNGRGGIIYCEQAAGSLLSFMNQGEGGREFYSHDSLTQEFKRIANDYVIEKNAAFVGDDVFVKVNLFDVSRSGCQSEEECRLLKYKISRFAQDQFHVRKSNGYNTLTLASEYTFGVIDSEIISYATEICGLNGSVADPLAAVAGGNMFVCDSIVFIGKDMLRMYKTKPELRKQIGAADTSDKCISEAIVNSVFDGTGGSVVWVGTKETKRVRDGALSHYGENRYQPLYHIDLFFHPLGGERNSSNEKRFTYLFSDTVIPIHPYLNISREEWNEAQRLTTWLKEVGDSLDADLRALGYSPIRISLPVYLQFDAKLAHDAVYSPTNGISERLNGFKYYFPAYEINMLASLLKVDSATIASQLQVEIVKSSYDTKAGLHCFVKPIEFITETH